MDSHDIKKLETFQDGCYTATVDGKTEYFEILLSNVQRYHLRINGEKLLLGKEPRLWKIAIIVHLLKPLTGALVCQAINWRSIYIYHIRHFFWCFFKTIFTIFVLFSCDSSVYVCFCLIMIRKMILKWVMWLKWIEL